MNMTAKITALTLFILITLVSTVSAKWDSYNFELNLDEKAGVLSGKVYIAYWNNSGQDLDEIHFRLDMNMGSQEYMEILAVRDGEGKELKTRYIPFKFGKLSSDKGWIAVILSNPLKKGKEEWIEMDFRMTMGRALKPELTMLQDDPYFSLDAWYPKAASFKSNAWRVDDDRLAEYQVAIELSSDLVVASTGRIVEEESMADNRKMLRLQADRVRGFTIYGSTSWKVHTKNAKGVDIRCLLPEDKETIATHFLEAAADTIAFYQTEYGEFPCKHLDIICPVAEQGGGAFAACNVIGVFISKGIKERYKWFVAHEVAHQYFGNLIAQRRCEIYWIIVGLGMVMDRQYLIQCGHDDRFHRNMANMYPMVKKQNRNCRLSQTVEELMEAKSPWSMQWNLALGHGKAYAVCSLLEDLIGEESFKNVIRRIISKHAGGIIKAEDLIALCEKEYGDDLSWFTADWIEGDAVLDYKVNEVKKTAEGWDLIVMQVGSASFPVTVEVQTKSGNRLLKRVTRGRKVNSFHLSKDEEPLSVIVDPKGVYPDMNSSNNSWPE